MRSFFYINFDFDYINRGWLNLTLSHLSFMEKLDIKDYLEQLKQVCNSCKRADKCKDHKKLCIVKRLCWSIAKHTYEKRVREGKLG